MKKKAMTYFLSIVLLIPLSCERERGTYTKIKGTVREYNSDKIVENALVKLVFLQYRKFTVIEHIMDTVRTDHNGNYSFEINTEADDHELLVYAETEQHFSHNATSDVPEPETHALRGVNQHIDLEVIPFAWLKINAVNSLGNDYVWVNRIRGSKSKYGFHIWEGIEKLHRTVGNFEISIDCFLNTGEIRTGVNSYYIQTQARDTSEITIHY